MSIGDGVGVVQRRGCRWGLSIGDAAPVDGDYYCADGTTGPGGLRRRLEVSYRRDKGGSRPASFGYRSPPPPP